VEDEPPISRDEVTATIFILTDLSRLRCSTSSISSATSMAKKKKKKKKTGPDEIARRRENVRRLRELAERRLERERSEASKPPKRP
jgi:hypothetical protein